MILRVYLMVFFAFQGFLVSLPAQCAQDAYVIHVRSSFLRFTKTLFARQSPLVIRGQNAPMLLLSTKIRGGSRGPHLILGWERQRDLGDGPHRFVPYVQGALAIIAPQDHPWTLDQWLASQNRVIGQDPELSSTGRAFDEWAKGRGWSQKQIDGFFVARAPSLAASFLMFQKDGQPMAMVGYGTTPKMNQSFPVKAMEIPGAREVWGYVITPRGQRDPRTKEIIETLHSDRAHELIKDILLLSPVSPKEGGAPCHS